MATGLVFSSCPYDAFRGEINFAADIFGVILVDGSYKADRAVHTKRGDVKGEIKDGGGYKAGGLVAQVTLEREGDITTVSLSGVSIRDASITARGLIYFKRRNGDAAREELVAYVDFGRDVTSTNGAWVADPSKISIQN